MPANDDNFPARAQGSLHEAGQAAAIQSALPAAASIITGLPPRLTPLADMWYIVVVEWLAAPGTAQTEEAPIPRTVTEVLELIREIERPARRGASIVTQVLCMKAHLAKQASGAVMDVTEEIAIAMFAEWKRDGGSANGAGMPSFVWRHLPARFDARSAGSGEEDGA